MKTPTFLTILTLSFTLLSVGCFAPAPNPQAPQPSPFADPSYGPYGPPGYPSGPAVCPPGCPNCPNPNYGYEVRSGNASLVNMTAAEEVKGQNRNQSCPNCPSAVQRPQYRQPQYHHRYPQAQHRQPQYSGPPIPLRPGEVLLHVGPMRSPASSTAQMPRPDQSRPSVANPCPDGNCPNVTTDSDEKPREGVFGCQRCGRRVVGDEWHELWADDDTPLTCLCEQCWRSLSPTARHAELTRYARRISQGRTPSLIIQAAIREASAE